MQSQIQIGELIRVHALGCNCEIGIIVDTDFLMLQENYEDNIYLVMTDDGSFEWCLPEEVSPLGMDDSRNENEKKENDKRS